MPWGVSESAFNVMDLAMTYQYRAFGVPGLGLKAGLGEDLVIAPYATALAALVAPRERGRELPRARGDGRARSVRLLRRDRLHDRPRSAGAHERRREDVHGAPRGHDARRARQCAPRDADAGALSPRSAREGIGAAPRGARPGARAARTSSSVRPPHARAQRAGARRRGARGPRRAAAHAHAPPRSRRSLDGHHGAR